MHTNTHTNSPANQVGISIGIIHTNIGHRISYPVRLYRNILIVLHVVILIVVDCDSYVLLYMY